MTGLDLSEVRAWWVAPAARLIGVSDAAHIAMATGIGAVESDYRHMVQMDGGPARGFWQMEPETHDSIWNDSLPAPRRSRMATGLRQILRGAVPDPNLMVMLPIYGAAMCIVRIVLAPAPLPDASDAAGMCAYWKQFYNTSGGAGAVTPDRVALFQAAISA